MAFWRVLARALPTLAVISTALSFASPILVAGRAAQQDDPVIGTEQWVSTQIDDPAPAPIPEPVPLSSTGANISSRLAKLFSLLPLQKSGTFIRLSRGRHMRMTFSGTRVAVGTLTRPKLSGTAPAARRIVTATIGCDFRIWDENENLWDWTYDARIYDPGNNLIARAQNWANDKPSYSSNLATQLSDPAEGTYTCRIDWWADSYYVGQPQAQGNLTYTVPTGETSAVNGWNGPHTVFRQTLLGGTFSGRVVHEENGSGSRDDCWYSGSQQPKYEALAGPGLTATVNSTGNYDDDVGWGSADITYYRAQNRTPCQTTIAQKMMINRPGTSDVNYSTSNLELGINFCCVWNRRLGAQDTRIWPPQ